MKNMLLAFMLILFLAPAVADAAKPIMNLRDVPVSVRADGSSYTDQEVQAVIIKGCLARGWQPVLDGQGQIHAMINVRSKHFAEIEIPFTAASYSIIYVSSDNLDYNEKRQTIHRNYNNWVVKLSATINKEFRRTSQNMTPTPAEPHRNATNEGQKVDIYSEILKLDDLRDRGILSDEEFEAEKRKLLEQD